MIVVGIDLSGPSNPEGSAAVAFRGNRTRLRPLRIVEAAGDEEIWELVRALPRERIVVGLDAPLSYNIPSGQRAADGELRRLLTARKMPSGSVMAPTMTRMAYLTLRGVAVARLLEQHRPRPEIVEVHPSAAFVLHGAHVPTVRTFKKRPGARRTLLAWLERQGMAGARKLPASSHDLVAACGAAFAAWQWKCGRSAWIAPARRPFHPYDFAC